MFRILVKMTAAILFGTLSLCAQNATSAATAAVTGVPRLVNYSGKATDVRSKPLSGIMGITFAIYKDQEGGATLWMETQNVTADAKGNYTVQLGSTTPDGLALDLFSSGEARWLGVSVNGAEEQPRVLLLSVPYALKAVDAETIGGLPPSAFLRADANASLKAPAKFEASRTVPTGQNSLAAKANVTGKGTVNFVPLWDSTSDIVNSSIFQKNANVGIGTTTPAAALDVSGKGDIRDTLTLFPKGTDPILAVNGTTFKVDAKGKVTFVSGQTFPGKGTVTSVAMTAPTLDFTVTGSPITKSGTLGLNWIVAPSSSNFANAIVKRDDAGNISTGEIFASSNDIGVNATGANAGVYGTTTNPAGNGVWGNNPNHTGVYGTGIVGVWGRATGYGIFGVSTGTDANADGVHGETSSAGASGVAGLNRAGGTAIYGAGGNGVIGSSGIGGGVGVGAYNSSTGDALFAENQSGGFAAFFFGDVDVDGNLSKAGGSFKIDHPLDPANKYLYHSFVESPDMMDIYNGNVTTDGAGNAVVTMPDWFEALNRDFRYQLTVMGQFAQAIVATKMANHSFAIKTDKPNVEVSWQLTGVRHDAWADAHRIPVEQMKAEPERGFYMHPELFGADREKSVAAARHPGMKLTLENAQHQNPIH
jgi:trimeric autotransporter adhesin